MNLKSKDLNHFSPAAAPAAEFNNCVNSENAAVHGSCLRKPRARLAFPVTHTLD
jgi:hypothetical protein